MDEPPVQALRSKKDSSMRVAVNLVKAGEAHAAVSAGNTGALMAISRFVLKTIPGIDRPAIATVLPNMKGGYTYVLDLGANVPAASFLEAARDANRLIAVMIAATTPGKDRTLRASIRALRAGGITVPILVGGGAIDDAAHARRLGADHWSGPDARSAVGAAERAAGVAAGRRR